MDILNEDFVKENELKPEVVDAIKSSHENAVAELKKEWDGLANTNAEKILDGASKKAKEMFGVDVDREQGEKYGDYLNRISSLSFESAKSALDKKQAEIDAKLKDFKGGDEYKQQLEDLRNEKDTLLKQVAELEPLKGLDEKYKEATEKLSGLKLSVAFNEVKPSFPTEVNAYEAKAKWDEFKKSVLDQYDIEIVDNEAMAIDKENKYKAVKLSELVKQDQNITELLQGRKQSGTGAKPKDLRDVEGVPFKVPADADGATRSKLIREYLTGTLKLDVASQEYSKQFSELNLKIAKAGRAA